MYKSIKELLQQAEEQGKKLSEIVLKAEAAFSEVNEKQVYSMMEARYEVMKASSEKALREATKKQGNLISGIAKKQYEYSQAAEKSLCGEFINRTMARALSSSEVNASMGRICAMPTAGSCGIVPAVVISAAEKYGASKEDTIMAMITASGLGGIVTENATVAGAEGGCQAECGVAAAMAAAAAVELAGGTPAQAVTAFSISIMNIMGLICDPVGGLVQVPCAHRNASQAVNAMVSADMAMAGIHSYIDPDEVVEAMYKVGKMLPSELRETALGGVAATESGHIIIKELKH